MRTLIADDNNEIRAALRLLIQETAGDKVFEAGDLAEALALVRTLPPDLILLDWDLPRGTWTAGASAEFVRDVKKNSPSCGVIAMSGRPEARGESLRLGCDAFISRNDPPDKLLAVLGSWREGRG